MIEPLGLEHLWLLRRLGKRGTPLGLRRTLVRPVSPLWRALSSTLFFHEPGTCTWVLSEKTRNGVLTGLIQLWERPGRPEAEIIYIAPSPSENPDVQAIWSRLLSQAIAQAGERGIQRIFVDIPCDSEEAELFRQAGFTAYAREDVLRLPAISGCAPPVPPPGVRRMRHRDGTKLTGLYASITPRPVQQAEGQCPCQWHAPSSPYLPVWGEEIYILENPAQSAIEAYLQLTPGTAGHWLEVTSAPSARDRVEALIDFGLARISNWTAKPVYTAVREYQAGVLPVLQAKGFEPFSRQAAMVKHTTVLAKDPVAKLLTALDKRVDPATPPVTMLNSEAVAEPSSIRAAAIMGPCRE